jgi:hypothetical protein
MTAAQAQGALGTRDPALGPAQPVLQIPPPAGKSRYQKRIDGLVRRLSDSERRAKFLEGENEELEKLLAKSQDIITRYQLELTKAKEKLNGR